MIGNCTDRSGKRTIFRSRYVFLMLHVLHKNVTRTFVLSFDWINIHRVKHMAKKRYIPAPLLLYAFNFLGANSLILYLPSPGPPFASEWF